MDSDSDVGSISSLGPGSATLSLAVGRFCLTGNDDFMPLNLHDLFPCQKATYWISFHAAFPDSLFFSDLILITDCWSVTPKVS